MILKKYLREIPEPILTHELHPYFLQTLDVSPDDNIRITYIQCLMCLLPPSHLVSVECLFELFIEISRNAAETQMTNSNLARVLAPTILRQANKDGGSTSSLSNSQEVTGAGLTELETAAQIVEFMLDTYPRWGRLTSPRAKPFLMLSGESVSGDLDPGAGQGHLEEPEDRRASVDSFRRGDEESPLYDSRRSFSFTSTGDSVQHVPVFYSPVSPASDGSGRTAAFSWRSPTGSTLPPINLTLTVQETAVTVPLGPPTASSHGEEELVAWPDGPQVRRSRTAPAKRTRGGWFRTAHFRVDSMLTIVSITDTPPSSPTHATPTSVRHSVSYQGSTNTPHQHDTLRRSISNAADSLSRTTRRGGENDQAANEARIRSLETEVANLTAQIQKVIVGHEELTRRLSGGSSS
jgi:hypothetical protein